MHSYDYKIAMDKIVFVERLKYKFRPKNYALSINYYNIVARAYDFDYRRSRATTVHTIIIHLTVYP